MVIWLEGRSKKNVPAILNDRAGERILVRGIKYNEATGKLPEVIRYREHDFVIQHNPGRNVGPLNPPIYREVDTQRIS